MHTLQNRRVGVSCKLPVMMITEKNFSSNCPLFICGKGTPQVTNHHRILATKPRQFFFKHTFVASFIFTFSTDHSFGNVRSKKDGSDDISASSRFSLASLAVSVERETRDCGTIYIV
jgi:hypothetical protein